MTEKLKFLEEILGELEISDFSNRWIENSNTDEDSIRQVYELLKGYGLNDKKIASRADLLGRDPETIERNYQSLRKLGLNDKKIASRAELLGRDPETIERNYQSLRKLGLSDEKIASKADLLGRDPETIERNYQSLQGLGLSDEKIASKADLLGRDPETIERNYQSLRKLGLNDKKIASRAELLGMNPETIERNYQSLRKLGLSDKKIATLAQLLGRDPETIERNYQYHVGLLRQDYTNRSSGRDLLLSQASLLGIPGRVNKEQKKGKYKCTVGASFQYLSHLGLDKVLRDRNGEYKLLFAQLLGTKPQTKRIKLAWMLREVFDYRESPDEEKRAVINRLYNFVRDNPSLLLKSINSLERNRERLIEKAQNYR